MAEDQEVAWLVSRLMAGAVTTGERRAIAVLADEGLFHDHDFRQQCVPASTQRVAWRRVVEMWVRLDVADPRRPALEDSAEMAMLAQARPPESLEELQVRIELDDVNGIVLATWRDAYAEDPRDPNPYRHHVDLCLDTLREQFKCWNCGRPAAGLAHDDLPVCSICKETI